MTTSSSGYVLHDAEAELRARIHAKGRVTFAEFSEVALYWPSGGYYSTRKPLGPQGDFYTAPLTHPVFGALVARQLAQQWELLGRPSPFWAIEPGAGSGQLARDILSHAPQINNDFAGALRYVAVDVQSPPPISVRPEALEGWPRTETGLLQWVRSTSLPVRGVTGCILANELLDAMPVHRVTVQDGVLREIYVALNEKGAFIESIGELSTPALAERFERLGVRLSEGYRAEVNLGIELWLQKAADTLDRGYVLLIDYGHDASTLYDESRRRGTLRCYYRHTLSANPYVHVGKQDISVHVDFTTVQQAAKACGLRIHGYTTQERFLLNTGIAAHRQAIVDAPNVPPPVKRANLEAIDTLVHPESMGGFKVLALGKHAPDAPLIGFTQGSLQPTVTAPLLATSTHMPSAQLAAMQPPGAMPTWEELGR